MDDEQLRASLNLEDVPPPDENARDEAVNLALAAFDEAQQAQEPDRRGVPLWVRLIRAVFTPLATRIPLATVGVMLMAAMTYYVFTQSFEMELDADVYEGPWAVTSQRNLGPRSAQPSSPAQLPPPALYSSPTPLPGVYSLRSSPFGSLAVPLGDPDQPTAQYYEDVGRDRFPRGFNLLIRFDSRNRDCLLIIEHPQSNRNPQEDLAGRHHLHMRSMTDRSGPNEGRAGASSSAGVAMKAERWTR